MTTTRPQYSRPWYDRPLFARPPLFAFGADSGPVGYSTDGDVLVDQNVDGVDLQPIWDDAASVMNAWNQKHSALAALVSYSAINVGDAISQAPGPITSRLHRNSLSRKDFGTK